MKERIGGLLGQLASEKYREREETNAQLKKLLDTKRGVVLGQMQEALKTTKDPEVKKSELIKDAALSRGTRLNPRKYTVRVSKKR